MTYKDTVSKILQDIQKIFFKAEYSPGLTIGVTNDKDKLITKQLNDHDYKNLCFVAEGCENYIYALQEELVNTLKNVCSKKDKVGNELAFHLFIGTDKAMKSDVMQEYDESDIFGSEYPIVIE